MQIIGTDIGIADIHLHCIKYRIVCFVILIISKFSTLIKHLRFTVKLRDILRCIAIPLVGSGLILMQ